jgi:hypothetical protein
MSSGPGLVRNAAPPISPQTSRAAVGSHRRLLRGVADVDAKDMSMNTQNYPRDAQTYNNPPMILGAKLFDRMRFTCILYTRDVQIS